MRRTLLILSVVILSGFLGTRALGQSLSTTAQLALVGGTIYASPTEKPIRNGVILIDGDKIIAVGRRSSVRVPRDQRHRLHRIDDYGGLLEQPCPLPRKKVDRCRNAPFVRTQPAASNDDHAVWVYERVRYMVDVGEHAPAANRIEAGEVAGPRIRSTGQATFPKGVAATSQAEMAHTGDLGRAWFYAS